MAEKTNETNNTCTNYFDEMLKLGKIHKRFLWIAGLCYFFDQMDVNFFGQIAPAVKLSLNLNMAQIAQLNSLAFWGMFLGGLIGGWLGDKIGRKNGLIICLLTFSIACLINGITSNYLIFCICRFLTGIGTIGMVIIAMVYMTEMMPSHNRGKYQALAIASGTIGVPFSMILGAVIIPLSPEAWRNIFFIGGAGIFIVPLAWLWLLESPRWLISKGRVEEAEAIVAECVGHKVDLSQKVTGGNNEKTSIITAIKVLLSPSYRKRSLVTIVMALGVTLGGTLLGPWYPMFLTEMGIPLQAVLIAGAIAVFGVPLGDFITSFFSDKGGRKGPIVAVMLMLTVVLVIMGLIPTLVGYVAGMFLGSLLKSCAGTLYWTYLSESFPSHVRSMAAGLMMSVARALVAMSQAAVPMIFAAGGWFGIHGANALLFLIPAIVVLILGEKTANKTLEEIEATASGH